MSTENTIMNVRSPKALEQVCEDLQAAVANHGFGVMAIHDLKATMAKKGVEFGRECRVFEVCNPNEAKKVLEANLEVSTALPCRISVYGDGAETVMSTIRPTFMLELFDVPGIKNTATEVEGVLAAIMEEAAAD